MCYIHLHTILNHTAGIFKTSRKAGMGNTYLYFNCPETLKNEENLREVEDIVQTTSPTTTRKWHQQYQKRDNSTQILNKL